MNLSTVLAFLAPFEPLLKPELMNVEAQAVAELNAVIAKVSSPDLKELLSALAGAIDGFAKLEVGKLP